MGERDVLRINSDVALSDDPLRLSVESGTFSFIFKGQPVRLDDLDAVWYRKGEKWLCNQFTNVILPNHPAFTQYLGKKLEREAQALSDYVHGLIAKTTPCLGSYTKCELNKLFVLDLAACAGLLVPEFYVCSAKSDLEEIRRGTPRLITKALSDVLYLFDKAQSQNGYFSYTEEVTDLKVSQLPDILSPSLIQRRIDKSLDIRSFFLAGEVFSMAIHSQSDDQTKTDFRKYNEDRPNRCVPFQLPQIETNKLRDLFDMLNLNSGSADFAVDAHGDFYFLEINPVGQFGMMSESCNYNLERKVANKLIEYAKATRKRRLEK